ncbi:MAG: GNAT family N-acetyltransferase [Magnetococcus sp. THC-1_WYH]
MIVRPARIEDVANIVALIRRLAAFEHSSTAVVLTEEMVRRDCFGEQPRFRVLLAEADGCVRGLVTLLETYSSWAGAPTMIVHDLYVDAEVRGHGLGKALMAAVARLAMERECCRVDVNVLAWNTTARTFYETLGFFPREDWLPYRLETGGIKKLVHSVPEG